MKPADHDMGQESASSEQRPPAYRPATFSSVPVGAQIAAGTRLILTATGRRGVRIYGVPHEHLAMAIVFISFTGIPFFLFVAMIPIWDSVGELPWVWWLNAHIAPAVNALHTGRRQAPFLGFRFFVAATSVIELLFLANVGALFSKTARKHALLVWLCFDHTKLLLLTGISGLILAVLWCGLFYDWTIYQFLMSSNSREANRIDLYMIIAIPNVALLFGHLCVICLLGASRDAYKRVRVFLRERAAPMKPTADRQ